MGLLLFCSCIYYSGFVDATVGFQSRYVTVCDKFVGYGENRDVVNYVGMIFGEVFGHSFAETTQTAAVLDCYYAAVALGGYFVKQTGVQRLEETHVVNGG